MKPIVIYIDKNSSKITLTKEEFEKHLKDAYDAGYNTGYNKGKEYNCYKQWWNSPITTTPYYTNNNQEVTTTPLKEPFKYTEITCEAHNAIGE